ncbi:MAG TPA: hypothetical protein VEA60_00085 [Allosphingosinicella sp.]|nr:hypothetical protein [Allosphingosinicella sp.]
MKKSLALLLLVAACNRSDAPSEQSDGSAPSASGPEARRPPPESGLRLTGLYESAAGGQRNQLCMVEKGGETQFGLIVWGGNLHSCSGAGLAERSGERLSLRMTGDETCAIEASLKGGNVTLPASLPAGCAYYCGARATLAGATFARAGTTAADAKKATDIAGDPLCD